MVFLVVVVANDKIYGSFICIKVTYMYDGEVPNVMGKGAVFDVNLIEKANEYICNV